MYKKLLLTIIVINSTQTGIISYAGNVAIGTIKTAAWGGCTALTAAGAYGAYYAAENYEELVSKGSYKLGRAIYQSGHAEDVLEKLSNPNTILNLIKIINGGKKACYAISGALAIIALYTTSKTVKSAFRTIIPQ